MYIICNRMLNFKHMMHKNITVHANLFQKLNRSVCLHINVYVTYWYATVFYWCLFIYFISIMYWCSFYLSKYFACVINSIVPVSYTHLDVYKRQTLY